MSALHTAPSVLIRAARGSDGSALRALAEIDSAETVPAGPLLVAEADGELVAALAPRTGERIANPFRHTADVVALLELRAGGARAPRSRRSFTGRLRLRPMPRARTA